MALSKGDIIQLIDLEHAEALLSDWINSKMPRPRDIAIVEEVSLAEVGHTLRLLCGSKEGEIEWRASFIDVGLNYVVLSSGS